MRAWANRRGKNLKQNLLFFLASLRYDRSVLREAGSYAGERTSILMCLLYGLLMLVRPLPVSYFGTALLMLGGGHLLAATLNPPLCEQKMYLIGVRSVCLFLETILWVLHAGAMWGSGDRGAFVVYSLFAIGTRLAYIALSLNPPPPPCPEREGDDNGTA